MPLPLGRLFDENNTTSKQKVTMESLSRYSITIAACRNESTSHYSARR